MRSTYLTILLCCPFLCILSPCGRANQSIAWSPCGCGEESYTLTLLGTDGTYEKSPDSATYAKGETVFVQFTPNADKRLTTWTCNPPSHMASGSTADTVTVFITGNTSLRANTTSKYYTLSCSWIPTNGTVALPPGGQGDNDSFTVPNLEYGTVLTLTATPNSGYYAWWQGGGYAPWAGQRYSNSIDVKIEGDVNLAAGFGLLSQYPAMTTLTVNLEGGSGQTFCAGHQNASFTAGPYPYNSVSAPGPSFAYRVAPASGYSLTYVSWKVNNTDQYTTSDIGYGVAANTYTAHLVKKIKLNVETEGQGVVTSPDFYYSWNPQPYGGSGATLTPSVSANQVQMTADACPGWRFDHWKYKNAAGQWVTAGTTETKIIYMNWWTATGQLHVPNGQETFSAKAVFYEGGFDHGEIQMPFRYRTSENGTTNERLRIFRNAAIFDPGLLPTYCCEDHRDPDGNRYQHAHLPHGFPFYHAGDNVEVTVQMSDWAWNYDYANQSRQSGSTFSKNCFAYACDAPTVIFYQAWYNNFTLPSSLGEITSSIRSYGDEGHVIRITDIDNIGTEGNPEYVVSSSSEKNASGGVYAGAWLPLGMQPYGVLRKRK